LSVGVVRLDDDPVELVGDRVLEHLVLDLVIRLAIEDLEFDVGPTPGLTLTAGRKPAPPRKEAIRSLKRRISDTIYRAMLADAHVREANQLHSA
jgi:hypothetical protein